MGELLCHLVGDYCLQNHWMAMNKTKSTPVALVHATAYSLPFLVLILWSWTPYGAVRPYRLWPLLIIWGTHFLIDRLRLASYWVRFYGNGEPGWLPSRLHEANRQHYVYARRGGDPRIADQWRAEEEYDRMHPLPAAAPPHLKDWLGIAVDNTFHLLINHWALML